LHVLTPSEFVCYHADGKVRLDSRTFPSPPEVGSALSGGPIGPHFVENVGNKPLHILAVELKG